MHPTIYPLHACAFKSDPYTIRPKQRRASRGWGAAAPESGKAIVCRANANFFAQKPAVKNKKNGIY